jgi:hypothetical protein
LMGNYSLNAHHVVQTAQETVAVGQLIK